MRKTIYFLLLSIALFISCGGSNERQTDPNIFSLLADSDRAPGPGWFGLYDAIERKTGVKVELRVYPYQAALEQKNITISTGNYADAIGGWIIGANDIMLLSTEEIIIPLDGMMENTVNIKEALEVPGVRAAMTLPDGHIYSPPYLVEEPLITFSPWINQTWLDQLGLNMPSTTEEFKQVLIAFRDRIPNTGGQRIIPFSADPNNLDLGALAGWWGLNASGASNNAGFFSVVDGRVESTIIRQEYRELISFMADLYRERLIDQELFTQDLATWVAKGRLGLYGVSVAHGAGDFHPEIDPRDKESDPSRNWGGWAPLPVLRAPGVSRPVFRNNNFGNTLFRNQFIITDKAGDLKAENIVRWLDAVYDPVHSFEMNAGPMDISWRILSRTETLTIFEDIDKFGWTEDERQKNGWGGYSVASLPRFSRPRAQWRQQPRPGWENEYKEHDVRDEVYRPYIEEIPMPPVWLDASNARRAADLQTPIAEYVRQKQAEWISGQSNVDAEWDSYVEQLNRMGLQELLAMKRNAARF